METFICFVDSYVVPILTVIFSIAAVYFYHPKDGSDSIWNTIVKVVALVLGIAVILICYLNFRNQLSEGAPTDSTAEWFTITESSAENTTSVSEESTAVNPASESEECTAVNPSQTEELPETAYAVIEASSTYDGDRASHIASESDPGGHREMAGCCDADHLQQRWLFSGCLPLSLCTHFVLSVIMLRCIMISEGGRCTMNSKKYDWQEAEALRRYQLIAPLLDAEMDPAKKVQLREKLAEQHETSTRTFYRYEEAYRSAGFSGLKPADRTQTRSKRLPDNFDDLLQEAIQLKREVPHRELL